MQPSIFKPTFGNKPDQLIGRDAVIAGISDALNFPPGSRARCTLLLGQRGMGKTALLLEAEDKAKEAGFVVAKTSVHSGMLEEIIELIQLNGTQYVGKEKKHLSGISGGALGFSFGLTFQPEMQNSFGFRVKLSMLCDALAQVNKGVLLLIDEVRPASDDIRTLAATYQNLVGEGKNIAIIMAGLPAAISATINDSVLTFLNRSQKFTLSILPEADVRAYYATTFKRLGIRANSDVLTKAASATQGFPYLLQLIGFYIQQYCSAGNELDEQTCNMAIESAMQIMDEDIFESVLNPLSDKDMDFLIGMSQIGVPCEISSVQSLLGVSSGYVQTYKKRLVDAGIIQSPKRGMLDFAVPYLNEYLHRQA
jgi:hypothetical protein